MEKILNYNIHNIVRMRISIRGYRKALAKTLEQKFSHYLTQEEVRDPDISVCIGAFEPDTEGAFVLDDHYHIKDDYLYCRHVYKFAKWKVAIEGFGKTTTLRIESNAAGWWVFPGGTIYALLMFKLTRKGFVALHASSVSRGDKAYVFTGRSGTGKTITVFNLTKRGFRYLGDDTTIIGNGEAFSFVKPLNIRFTYDVRRMLGLTFGGRERLSIFLKNILRIISMGYINLFTKVDVRDIFPDCIGTKGTLDKLFFMVSSPRFSIQEAPDRAPIVRQMFMNMLFELEELSGYLLAYTYVFPDSDLREFWKNARRIIEESVERKSTYSVSMPFTYSHEDFKRLEKAIA